MSFDPAEHPHRRHNPLRDEWLLVSPHRAKRPWQGQADAPDTRERPAHAADCFLCPGNRRANGERNPDYAGPWVFANDFAALLPDTPVPVPTGPFQQIAPARGEARVICYDPHHSLTMADMTVAQIGGIIDCWADQSAELGSRYAHVQIFETKGALLGASSPHPHGQVWATDYLPQEVATEERTQSQWLADHGQPMLLALADAEADGPRVVVQHADWLAIVPWWADWPFETLLLPRFPVTRMEALSAAQRQSLALALAELTGRYDNLFTASFPYLMGWHGAPHSLGDAAHWQLHAHFQPPLLRSASVRKFKAGYEAFAEAQRDLTAEQAAARLAAVPAIHYRRSA